MKPLTHKELRILLNYYMKENDHLRDCLFAMQDPVWDKPSKPLGNPVELTPEDIASLTAITD